MQFTMETNSINHSNESSGNSKIVQSKKITCVVCDKHFTRKDNLDRHILEHNSPTPQKFVCDSCDYSTNRKDNLTRHSDLKHSVTANPPQNYECHVKKSCFSCSNCDFTSSKFKDLIEHYSVHDFEIKRETHKFSSKANFFQWKEEEEKQCFNKFVKHTATKKNASSETDIFYCHRSGSYKPKGKGERNLKIQGSKKTGKTCPSRMSITTFSNGEVIVDYFITHVGHEPDMCHLNLTQSERMTIANKIAMRIPFEEILDEVRNSVNVDTGLKRYDLLTRKDLNNIERCFNLSAFRGIRHENDAVSIESFVNESNSVLFFKPQGVLNDEFPQLLLDDFCLVIMNDSQKFILEKFGKDCICLDSTHDVDAYKFELTTLLVLDDLHQGFPCAFMISNKTNEHFMKIFFEKIKMEMGIISSKIFMSDMAEAFYNAWVKVMVPVEFRLFCAWHVDSAWRKNINKKLNCSFEEKKEVYKKLVICMQETDKVTFHFMLDNLVSYLKSYPHLQEFGHYFHTTYCKNTETWAYCYRLHSGLNTNMHLERMHRTIKHIYLRGKTNKRLDTCVFSLMNLIKDKTFDRLIGLQKGKLTSKLAEIRKRHKSSLEIPEESILYSEEEKEWIVKSVNSNKLYSIKTNTEECNCRLNCSECNICIHKYICTCIDSAIRWNLCKHVHAIARIYKNERAIGHSGHMSCGNSQAIESNKMFETMLVAAPSSSSPWPSTSSSDDFLKSKKTFLDDHLQNLNVNINTPEDLMLVKKLVKSILPTLEAVKQKRKFCQESNEPANKKICPQRLYKTKKTSSGRSSGMHKPTVQEEEILSLELINFKDRVA